MSATVYWRPVRERNLLPTSCPEGLRELLCSAFEVYETNIKLSSQHIEVLGILTRTNKTLAEELNRLIDILDKNGEIVLEWAY